MEATVIRRSADLVILLACATLLGACSPGGVVAGTVGAAGAVAGTAVDVILRNSTAAGIE